MTAPGKKRRKRTRNPSPLTLAKVQQLISARKLHREREFRKTAQYKFYKQAAARRLGKLMARKGKVNVEFVHQYYTQHIFYNGGMTFRDKSVVINAATLNQHYHLPSISDDDCMYQKISADKESFPYEAIAREIVVNGENAWFVRFSQKKYLARSDLTQEAKCWLHLAGNNIKPTSHLTYIQKKLALLIYLLQNNQPINLGKIMYKALYKCRDKHRTHLIFPHTITSLFLQAKVEQLPADILVEPDRPFTYNNLGSQPTPEKRETKRARQEGPRSELELQFEAMTAWIDRLENTFTTAIGHLTALVTRLVHHHGLPTNNVDGDKQDESADDDIRSTDEDDDDEEREGNTGSSLRKASRNHSDSDYTLFDEEDD